MPKHYKLKKEQLTMMGLTPNEVQAVKMLREGYFVVTHLHRDDLKALGFKRTSKIDNDTMVELASKMADDYCNQLFHDSLKILAEDMGI